MTRVFKASLGLGAGVVKTIVFTLTGFIVTPIVLRYLGNDDFAAYKMLVDWFALPRVVSGAIFASLSGAAATAISRNDWGEARHAVVDAINRSFWLGLAIASGGVLATIFIPYLIPSDTVDLTNLRIGALVFTGMSLLLPVYVFQVVLQADQKIYLLNSWDTIRTITYGFMAVGFAYLLWGIAGQVLALTIADLLVVAALLWYGLKKFPGIWRDLFKPAGHSQVGALFGASLLVMACMTVSQRTDNLVVGLVSGTANVTNFFLTQRLVLLVSSFVVLIGGSSWAGLLQLHSEGDQETFLDRLSESTHLVSAICWILLLPVLILNEEFLTAWVGPGRYSGFWITLVAAANAWLINLFGFWGWLINGKGLIREWAPFAVMFAMVNIVVSVLLTFTIGPIGALLGTLSALVFVQSWSVSLLSKRHLDIGLVKFWWAALKPALWGVPFFFLVSETITWRPSGLLTVFLSLGVLSLICGLINWVTVMSKEERKLWIGRFWLVLRTLKK